MATKTDFSQFGGDWFFLWEAFQGVGGRAQGEFAVSDNFQLYGVILTLATTIGGIDTSEKGIIATGATQATARPLTEDYNRVDTVAPGTGVRLDAATPGKKRIVVNNGANNLNVYPDSGENFFTDVDNIPVVLSPGTSVEVFCFTGEATTWTLIS